MRHLGDVTQINGCDIEPVDIITVRQDPAGNIKPDKAKSTEKIDGIVALIMALDRAIRNGGDEASESVYDERGLLFI